MAVSWQLVIALLLALLLLPGVMSAVLLPFGAAAAY
jgi:hypothetical protein